MFKLGVLFRFLSQRGVLGYKSARLCSKEVITGQRCEC